MTPCCPDWEPQNEAIKVSIELVRELVDTDQIFPGKPFKFCPWCGASRVEPLNGSIVMTGTGFSGPVSSVTNAEAPFHHT